MEGLRPCPACGTPAGEKGPKLDVRCKLKDSEPYVRVRCAACGCCCAVTFGEERVIKDWNEMCEKAHGGLRQKMEYVRRECFDEQERLHAELLAARKKSTPEEAEQLTKRYHEQRELLFEVQKSMHEGKLAFDAYEYDKTHKENT